MTNQTEPRQLELPLGEPETTESDMRVLIAAQQREIVDLRHRLDEVYALINKVWGAR